MTDIDENLKIQKITKLLEKGGTMLANHHECGAPMFRYQGKVLCPVCEGQTEQKKQEIKPEMKPGIKIESQQGSKNEWEKNNIGNPVKNNIQNIAKNLDSETDLQRVKAKLECIELGVKILKLLED